MWRDPLLRTLLALIVAVNFLAVGPLLVGIPQLVRERLSEGAGGFGLVMSAFGAGSLVGLALGGTLPKPPPRVTGSLLLAVCVVFGLGLAVLGFAHTLVAALLPALLMGLAVGYLMVFFFSWVQARTPQRMMGRMMSLVIFASVGLVPLSQLVSGAVARWSVTALFVGAAVLLGLVVARAWFVPALRAMGVEMATGDARALALADARGRVRGETTETRDVR
jgi:MFS family permease